MARPVKYSLKSVFAACFLLISIQAVSQGEFYKVYDFFPYGDHDNTWYVFEEEGGYVFTGRSDQYPQGNVMFIVKTNYQGDTVWSKEFKLGYPYWISNTRGTDGSKVFTVEDSIFLFDKDWNKTSLSPIDGVGHPRKVISLADGNYLFADRFASNNYTLVKVDSESLDVIWTSSQLIQDFQLGNGSGFDIKSILEMPDGEIIIITSNYFGTTFGPEYIGSTFFQLNSLGILSETTLIPEIFYYDTYIEDGNLVSLVYSFGDPYSIATHTTDGEVIDSFSFPYQYNIFQIRKNEDRVVVLRRVYQPNGFLVEEYKDETLLWSVQPSEPISLTEVIITSDGGYLVYGEKYYGPGGSYPCLLKKNSPLDIPEPIETHYSTLYPNPAGDVLVINKTPAASAGSGADITIYNTSGETLLTAWQKELPFTISTRTLPGGLYIVKVIMQGKVEILKFIKQ